MPLSDIVRGMAKVVVYRVKKYDILSDGYKSSRRMATREGARIMCAEVIEGTESEIDDSELESGEQWTLQGFDPPAS